MRNCLTYIDAINAIKLDVRHPSSSSKVWILVEGDSDIKVLKKFCNASVSIERIPGGVGKLVEAINGLCEENNRILGIRDKDFSFIEERIPCSAKYMFYTDCHDLEMTMIKNDNSMLSLASEYLTEDALKFAEIRNKIFAILEKYSYSKLHNYIEKVELNYQGFNFGTHYKEEKLNIEQIIDEINKRSPEKKREHTISDIEVAQMKYPRMNPELLICGHDFISIFSLYANEKKQKGVSPTTIACSLRTAYGVDGFRSTQIYENIKKWERENSISILVV